LKKNVEAVKRTAVKGRRRRSPPPPPPPPTGAAPMAALFAALPSAQHDLDAATLKEFESLTPEKKALVHAHLGNTDVAAMLLDHALKLRPANPEALLNLGVMREQQGRPDDAIRSYSEAYALEPSAAQAPHNLCNLLLHHYNAVSGEAAQAST
jgi:tetratricopeptide (TPR) repeat protein